MNSDMSIQTPTAFPIFHVGTIAELFCQMVDSILPFVELHPAKPAA